MNLLSVENLSKSYGERLIFNDISFGLAKGERVALIARNGTGKTSLLRAIVGQEPQDEGLVTFRKGTRIGYLSQEKVLDGHRTILETVFAGDAPVMKAIREYERLLGGPEDDAFYGALNEMERSGAWVYETKAKDILFKLGLNETDKRVEELSGGQKKRLGLAMELLKEPDFLILDEPTNHLDLGMIEWLEDYLIDSNITLLVVTHDRFFLDNVCTSILELHRGKMYRYKGDYAYYLEKKSERKELEDTVVGKAKQAMRKELEWIRRQPKARGTKAKYRIKAFDDIKATAKSGYQEDELKLSLNIPRMGSKVVELHKVRKSFAGNELTGGLTYHFLRKERVGIVGANGTGKSTLLNLITGGITPDMGKVVIGETVQFGYFEQTSLEADPDKKVIEIIREVADVIPLEKGQKLSAAQMLERFLFPRSMHFQALHTLSGGEIRRLQLLRVLMSNPNFLILDEPTNDLDIFTIQVLEEYLEEFPGVVLIVSHDRHFLDRIVDHCFVLEGDGKVKDFPGNFSQYRAQKEEALKAQDKEKEKAIEEPREASDVGSSEVQKEKVKLTYAERLEFQELDESIPSLEQKMNGISEALTETNDPEELARLTSTLGSLQDELDSKTERWMYLAEFAG